MPRSAEDRRDALRTGAEAETFVAVELRRRGWAVVAQNWRGGGGELDLIVHRDGAVRFVEVKARASAEHDPLESIDAGKRRRLLRAAEAWMAAESGFDEVCFLLAVVSLGEPWTVDFYDNPFDA